MNKYYLLQRLLGVAVILFSVFFGLVTDWDMTPALICVPIGLMLIFSKERLVDIDGYGGWDS